MSWWVWMTIGLILLITEISIPGGFYLFFTGCSALIVGMVKVIGFETALWFDFFLFSALSIFLVFFLRKRFFDSFVPQQTSDIDSLVGLKALAHELLPVGGNGKVHMRGTLWNALNVGSTEILAHQSCHVVKVDGLLLHVEHKDQK